MAETPAEPDTGIALQLLVALARCTHSVMKYCVGDILSHGFKVSEFEVLELLYHKGPATQGAIAARVLLTTGGITHIVDQLQGKGLVRRVPCLEDRRIVRAEITEAGREMMDRVFPPHAREVQRAVSGLSRAEQEQAVALLKKMGRAAAALTPEGRKPERPTRDRE